MSLSAVSTASGFTSRVSSAIIIGIARGGQECIGWALAQVRFPKRNAEVETRRREVANAP
jgi:hypothetical protein